MNLPSVSVVTPVLDRADTVAAAIESVRNQSLAVHEHIVVDGGSRDGTLDVLARYPHLQLRHGPDAGIYDAINKGIAQATGELVVLLNSDDLLASGAVAAFAKAAASAPEADIVSGGAVLADMGGRIVREYSDAASRALSYELVLLRPAIINARAFRRRILDRVGPFDLSFGIAADHDFLVRCLLAGAISQDLDQVVYTYRQHPTSLSYSTSVDNVAVLSEELMLLAERWLAEPGSPDGLRQACRRRHGRSILTLARLAIAGRKGGRLGALARDRQGRLTLRPALHVFTAMSAWLLNEPYARDR